MGSMIVEMEARIAAGEDFSLGANVNLYPKQSTAWRFYETDSKALVVNSLKGVPCGTIQT